MLKLSGITDEAGCSLKDQLRAHRILGWKLVELRTVNGKSIAEMSEQEFSRLEVNLEENHLICDGIASSIGNWNTSPTTPLNNEIKELEILLERASRLKARFIRIMSYCKDSLTDDEWRDLATERIRYFCNLAEGTNILLLHENCCGWGSQSPAHSIELVHRVNRNNFALLFDCGNPVTVNQSSIEWVKTALPYIHHVHIKDAKFGDNPMFTHIGYGNAEVKNCLKILFESGYKESLSIEPHLFTQPHLGVWGSSKKQLRNYIQYGLSLQNLVEQVLEDAP